RGEGASLGCWAIEESLAGLVQHIEASAKTMGITDLINPTGEEKPVYERIREMTGGGGVDYSFECTGNLNVLRDAFLSVHEGWGLTVLLGIHSSPKLLPIHPMELFDGRRIEGSIFGGFKGKSQLPNLATECMQGVMIISTCSVFKLKLC
ncbi:alcohol dehydrogenase-like 3-like, partial [Trifolium medium]|nr:alcohol dehydrogenase-like 3-like [Trifolium medium]